MAGSGGGSAAGSPGRRRACSSRPSPGRRRRRARAAARRTARPWPAADGPLRSSSGRAGEPREARNVARRPGGACRPRSAGSRPGCRRGAAARDRAGARRKASKACFQAAACTRAESVTTPSVSNTTAASPAARGADQAVIPRVVFMSRRPPGRWAEGRVAAGVHVVTPVAVRRPRGRRSGAAPRGRPGRAGVQGARAAAGRRQPADLPRPRRSCRAVALRGRPIRRRPGSRAAVQAHGDGAGHDAYLLGDRSGSVGRSASSLVVGAGVLEGRRSLAGADRPIPGRRLARDRRPPPRKVAQGSAQPAGSPPLPAPPPSPLRLWTRWSSG